MTKTNSVRSSTKHNLALALASAAFSLLLAESILRVFTVQETKRLAVYDQTLGWRGEPHGQGAFIRKKDQIHALFRYNEHGFRDESIAPAPTPNFRMLLLGDSFLEGLEVDYPKTFHKLVENRLNAALGDAIEAINISSQGYSTAQQLLALEEHWDLVDPQVVLLCFYSGNDLWENTRTKFAYIDSAGGLRFKPTDSSWTTRNYLTFKRWLYENSHLVFYLKNAIESHLSIRLADDAKEESANAEDQYRYRITELLLLRLRDVIEEKKRAFGIVIIPHKGRVKDQHQQAQEITWLLGLCRRESIPCLNLLPHLDPSHYYTYDSHFNERGHKVAADHIYSFLLSTYDMPSRSPAQKPVGH